MNCAENSGVEIENSVAEPAMENVDCGGQPVNKEAGSQRDQQSSFLQKSNQLRLLLMLLALPVAGVGLIVTNGIAGHSMVAHGDLQSAHADIDCAQCHTEAPGTVRQQIQANIRYLIGQRHSPADFGFSDVTSADCIACHERPNDRHPIYRFREPRFNDAVREIDATQCLGCHAEHVPERTPSGALFCAACHDDLKLKNDPLQVSHASLVSSDQWKTCMTCHDFHGNHGFKPPTDPDNAIPLDDIKAYLANGPDPYADVKTYKAKEQR